MKRILPFFLEAAIASLALFTLGGQFGRNCFELDLLSHFSVQYAMLGTIALLFCAMRRRAFLSLIAALTLGVNLYQLSPYLFRSPHAAPVGRTVRILFANVDVRNHDSLRLRSLIERVRPDVAVFTEVNARWENDLQPLREMFPHVLSDPREDKFGMMLFSNSPIERQAVIELAGVAFPSVIFDVTLSEPSGPMRLVAAHSPAPVNRPGYENRNKMLRRITQLMGTAPEPAVIVGDLNITPWSPVFRDFVAESKLTDARIGRGIFPTWSRRISPLMIPIDHCLSSRSVAIGDFSATEDFGSDHSGIVCEITAP